MCCCVDVVGEVGDDQVFFFCQIVCEVVCKLVCGGVGVVCVDDCDGWYVEQLQIVFNDQCGWCGIEFGKQWWVQFFIYEQVMCVEFVYGVYFCFDIGD